MKNTNKDSIIDTEQLDSSCEPHPDLMFFLTSAIETRDQERVRDLISGLHAADISYFITNLEVEQRVFFVTAISQDFDADILLDLDPSIKDDVIHMLGAKKSAEAITKLESDDAVHVIEDLKSKEQEKILEAIPEEKREELREGLAHPEDTAGRLMNKNFVAVPENWDVGKTIDFLRKGQDLPDDFYSIFVVNKNFIPVGSVLVSRVIRKNRDVSIKDIMADDLKTINLGMDQEEIAYIFQKYALASAPVVDKLGKMVAMITVDDVVDIISEEAGEDIMKMGGVGEADLHTSYIKTALHRFPWLFINLLTAIAASAVIVQFDESIEKLVALAVLMPIVASMAGNAGMQTLTISVRAIATKELTEINVRRVIRKEVKAALLNGASFGAIVFVASMMFYGDISLSAIFGIAVFFSLLVAVFSGAVIPHILLKMRVDPAASSVVFLTTITDIVAFAVFLGLASFVLL